MTLRRFPSLAIALLFATALYPALSAAASVELKSLRFSAHKPVPHFHYEGPVRIGDLERMAAAFAQHVDCNTARLPESGGNCAVVTMSSGGGNYVEGLKLAHFFRENAIATWVVAGNGCHSACAMAFMGGSGRSSTASIGAYLDRTVEPGGVIGFHSPYVPGDALDELVAEIGLDEVLGGNRQSIALMIDQLVNWNVDRSVIARLVAMGPQDLYRSLHPEDLYLLRVALPDAPLRMWTLDSVHALRNACMRLLAAHEDSSPYQVRDRIPASIQYDFGVNGEGQALTGFALREQPSGIAVSYCALPTAQAHLGADADISLYSGPGVNGSLRPMLTFFHRPQGWSTLGGGSSADRRQFQKGSIGHFFLPPDLELAAALAMNWRLMREPFLQTGRSGR